MDQILRLFVADKVPVSNKGEEAIIRGIEDLLRERDQTTQVALFDDQHVPSEHENIKVFPLAWVYPNWKKKHGQSSNAVIRISESQYLRVKKAVLIKLQKQGIIGSLGNLAFSRKPDHSEMRDFFHHADLILVGHDGIFGYEHCGVLHAAKQAGKRAGVLGAGGKGFRATDPDIISIYRSAFEEADFFVLRERSAYERMVQLCGESSKLRLAPDPAFAMEPAPENEVIAFLNNNNWYGRSRSKGKLIIGVTVCHKSCLLDRPFAKGKDLAEQIQLHSRYLADFFDTLLRHIDAFLVFLPHSIEPGVRNDLEAARGVTALMQTPAESFHVMDDDLSARMFKGIIKELDFIIGQRAHSLIGSASVTTPYIALTASDDSRTLEILGDMCGCEEQMIKMDESNPEEAVYVTLASIEKRSALKSHLIKKMAVFQNEFSEIRKLVRGPEGFKSQVISNDK